MVTFLPSHYVASTLYDLVDNMLPVEAEKLVLLQAATSPVPGFEQFADIFLTDMQAHGIHLATTENWTP